MPIRFLKLNAKIAILLSIENNSEIKYKINLAKFNKGLKIWYLFQKKKVRFFILKYSLELITPKC